MKPLKKQLYLEDYIANFIGDRREKTLPGKQMTFREDKWSRGVRGRYARPDNACVGVIRLEFFSERRFMTIELFWEALLLDR